METLHVRSLGYRVEFGIHRRIIMSIGILGLAGTPETIVATGSTIADAVAITQPITEVTGANGTAGAQLPALAKGSVIFVRSVGGNLKLYPHSSTGTINGGSAGANVLVATTEIAVCIKYSDTNWHVGITVAP